MPEFGNTGNVEATTDQAFVIKPRITSLTFTADKAAPQGPNTTVTFTAAHSGGEDPLQYRWYVYDGNAWTEARHHLFYDLDGNLPYLQAAFAYARRPDVHAVRHERESLALCQAQNGDALSGGHEAAAVRVERQAVRRGAGLDQVQHARVRIDDRHVASTRAGDGEEVVTRWLGSCVLPDRVSRRNCPA